MLTANSVNKIPAVHHSIAAMPHTAPGVESCCGWWVMPWGEGWGCMIAFAKKGGTGYGTAEAAPERILVVARTRFVSAHPLCPWPTRSGDFFEALPRAVWAGFGGITGARAPSGPRPSRACGCVSTPATVSKGCSWALPPETTRCRPVSPGKRPSAGRRVFLFLRQTSNNVRGEGVWHVPRLSEMAGVGILHTRLREFSESCREYGTRILGRQ